MTVRAKFRVVEHSRYAYSSTPGDSGSVSIVMRAEYDASIPDDQRFAASTPSGELKMLTTNPAVVERLALGKTFYLDFTEAEA